MEMHVLDFTPQPPHTTPPPSCQVSDQGTEGDEEQKKFLNYKYPAMSKTQGSFTLHVSGGAGWGADVHRSGVQMP